MLCEGNPKWLNERPIYATRYLMLNEGYDAPSCSKSNITLKENFAEYKWYMYIWL